MPAKPRVIYIGPEQIIKALQPSRPDWNFVASVRNIAELWDGLQEGTISNEVEVIITIDLFFREDGSDTQFEQLIATMSPYCLFLVLQYKPEVESSIRERVETSATALSSEVSDFYFIKRKGANVSIDQAKHHYIQNSENTLVADRLAGRESVQEIPEIEEMEAAKIVEQNAEFFEEVESDFMGKVVSCTSSKGGSGKSTVAITLATYLAHTSQNSVREGLEDRALKVIVLDLDVRDGQIGFLTGALKPTILNMRSNGINDSTLLETVIHSQRLGIDLLLAPKRPRLSDDTPPEFYLELIRFLKKHYDYIILDTSVNYLDPLLEKVAYPVSDLIVFVTDIVVNSVYSMTRWVQEVTKPKSQQGMGISAKKIGIVVNKSISNVNMSGEKIAGAALGIPVITVIPNNAKLIAHAANLQSMESVLKHVDIKHSIRRLARAVVGKGYTLSDTVFK